MEKPLFNWKQLEVSPTEAERARNLIEEDWTVSTFVEALDLLKSQRRRRAISIEDFTKGLIEIARATERFISHNEAFTETEIRLQNRMMEGFIELLCEGLRTFRGYCPYGEELERLRNSFKRRELSPRDYWKRLINLSVQILGYLHDADIPPKYLRFILSIIMSFVDYFQCVLIHKRELVEDFSD
jgi:hypothetical protein